MPSARSYRLYTREELEAWANYPLAELTRCGTLQAAVRWCSRHLEGRRADGRVIGGRQAPAGERKRRLDALPDMCYKHEHPLKCGRPGKLYGLHDHLGPIIDAITMMYESVRGTRNSLDAFGLFDEQAHTKRHGCKRKRDGYDEQEDAEERLRQTAQAVRRGSVTQDTRWRCEVCGNDDAALIVASTDGRCCPCGTMVRGALIDDGEEWRCHADDGAAKNEAKKRADHASVPQIQKDVEHGPVPPEERKAERARQRATAGKVTGVHTGSGLGRGLSDAQRIVERGRERDMRAQSGLSDREELKRIRILEELEKIFKKLKPIDHNVRKEVRRGAVALWLDAVRHAGACSRTSCCELRLVDRSPFIIASSVLALTVDSLIDGKMCIEAIEREHLVDLRVRMRRSAEFSNASSLTQMATAKRMIDLMQAPEFASCVPCAALPNLAAPVASAILAKPSLQAIPVRRSDSSLTNSGDNSPSGSEDQLPLRHAVAQVFLAHKSELPVSVKDGAVRALGSPGFVAGCQKLSCLYKASLQAIAFCVLNAVAREQAKATGPLFARGACIDQLDVPIAHKLKLDLAAAEEAIAAIRHLVPIDAASEASAPQNDNLFV